MLPPTTKLPKRRTIRLQEYDYSQSGYYFVTICAKNRRCLFGEIVANAETPHFTPTLSNIGEIVKECWLNIPIHYPNVLLDQYVIMPNHVHGIIIIDYPREKWGQNITSKNRFQHLLSGSLGAVIRGFKIGVTKWCLQNTPYRNIWQRNFYEHVIRNDQSHAILQEYIANNPCNWHVDELFSDF